MRSTFLRPPAVLRSNYDYRTGMTIDSPCSRTTHPGPPITCQQVCWTKMKISLLKITSLVTTYPGNTVDQYCVAQTARGQRGTVVRGMTRIICERYCEGYCGLWGIKILRGCRCSDSEGTRTAVRICTDCAGNSCHLQRTGDQFDVPSSSTLTSVKWRTTKFLNPISLLLTLTVISVKSTKSGKFIHFYWTKNHPRHKNFITLSTKYILTCALCFLETKKNLWAFRRTD